MTYKQTGNLFLEAVKNGDVELVDSLLDSVRPNHRDGSGRTALMLASQTNNINSWDIVDMLLNKGENVHAKDNNGCTALVYAVNNNLQNLNPNIIYTLLEHGADTNGINFGLYNNTVLINSVIRAGNNRDKSNYIDYISIIKYLLAAGADVNAKNKYNRLGDGKTAIDIARDMELTDIVKLLESGKEIIEKWGYFSK